MFHWARALGFDTPDVRWGFEYREQQKKKASEVVVTWADAVGCRVISPKAWIPVTVLLLIFRWLEQVVSPLWASFSSSVKWI